MAWLGRYSSILVATDAVRCTSRQHCVAGWLAGCAVLPAAAAAAQGSQPWARSRASVRPHGKCGPLIVYHGRRRCGEGRTQVVVACWDGIRPTRTRYAAAAANLVAHPSLLLCTPTHPSTRVGLHWMRAETRRRRQQPFQVPSPRGQLESLPMASSVAPAGSNRRLCCFYGF